LRIRSEKIESEDVNNIAMIDEETLDAVDEIVMIV